MVIFHGGRNYPSKPDIEKVKGPCKDIAERNGPVIFFSNFEID